MQELRRESEALIELRENLQHISRLSHAEQNTIEHLEDELSAGQQVAAECGNLQLQLVPGTISEGLTGWSEALTVGLAV